MLRAWTLYPQCLRLGAISCLVLGVSACTWQDALQAQEQISKTMRVVSSYSADAGSRWQISGDSLICLPADEAVPAHWLNSAVSGMRQHLRTEPRARSNCEYTVYVDWPGAPPALQTSLSGGLLGFYDWPKIPAKGELRVSVRDARGLQVTRKTLRVSPHWFAPEWTDTDHLSRVFAEFARDFSTDG
ncbi:MAG: hypothetical protein AAF541_16300 [Pseudomonadota bacterium]